ncbi:hypothetical protein [Rubritalea tangerina]|uniref:hypothetical protein n=1 Tax=Rubritalea tangerina TaxID=430798 RepID=UPI00361344E6
MRTHLIFILTCIYSLAALLTSCNTHKKFSSREELAKHLADGFSRKDQSVIKDVSHPQTPKDIKSAVAEAFGPYFELESTKVRYTYISLDEVPVDLPGSLQGQDLEYVSDVIGVIHFSGEFDTEQGVGTFDLYFPYSKSHSSYYSSATNYAQ